MAGRLSLKASPVRSSKQIHLPTAEVFEPLLAAARYKGAHGGRGSGKSHFFAEALVEECLRFPGLRAVCIREVQKSLKESAKRLIEDKIEAMGVGTLFEVQTSEIKTPGGGSILFQGMQDHTAESIKSLEGIDRAWIEEAQTLSEGSWRMLRPTIRSPGSEIWASWNPRRRIDPVDKFFRQDTHELGRVLCVEANWRDNPWFPDELEDERQDDLKNDPEAVANVWDGDYVTILKGAYYAELLKEAKRDGRITSVPIDPLMQVRAWWDIGGPGKKADAMSIWVGQYAGKSIHMLDYCEAVGQQMGYFTAWFRDRGWKDARKPLMVLPHDAGHQHADNPTGMDFEAQLKFAGYETKKVHSPPGVIMQRIQTSRRLGPRVWFNNTKIDGIDATEAGRQALGAFHEKWDEDRNVGLGPEHDWAIHGADAYGLGMIDYEEPRPHVAPARPKYGTMA